MNSAMRTGKAKRLAGSENACGQRPNMTRVRTSVRCWKVRANWTKPGKNTYLSASQKEEEPEQSKGREAIVVETLRDEVRQHLKNRVDGNGQLPAIHDCHTVKTTWKANEESSKWSRPTLQSLRERKNPEKIKSKTSSKAIRIRQMVI